jgi:hypothetical protein
VPIGGWVARNHGVAGSWTISSAEQVNLLYYSAAGAVAEETGEPRGDVAARMQMSLASTNPNPARRSTGASRATALSILIHHPQGAAVSSSRGLARLLFGPGTSEVRQLLAGKRGARLPLLSWPLAGYLLVLYLAVAAGVVRLIRTRNRPATVVLGSVALYFLMICTSPVAYSRFRAPLMPLFAIVAAIGIADVSRRRQGAPDLSGS